MISKHSKQQTCTDTGYDRTKDWPKVLWQPTPKLPLPSQGDLDSLPIYPSSVKAPEAGFDETKHPGRFRTMPERVAYVKLAQELRTTKNHYHTVRSRMFGKSSWFNNFVDATVGRHDFEAFCVKSPLALSNGNMITMRERPPPPPSRQRRRSDQPWT